MTKLKSVIPAAQANTKQVQCTKLNGKHTPPAAPECNVISEKQFMRDHSLYSAASSWLFALAGATNIGVLGVYSAKALSAVEKGIPLFKSKDPAVAPAFGNKKYNLAAAGMMAFGGACMAVSNWLESKKVVTEWQLGAGKLQRKANIAENEVAAAQNAEVPAETPKNWVAAEQARTASGSTLTLS